jgi:hypothetical protein
MESLGWKWCVVATVHSDSAVEISVEAGDQAVAKSQQVLGPLQALTAAMAALATFEEGDSVTALVLGKAVPMSTWTGTNAYAALYWLATTLSHACCAFVPHHEMDKLGIAQRQANQLRRQSHQN